MRISVFSVVATATAVFSFFLFFFFHHGCDCTKACQAPVICPVFMSSVLAFILFIALEET